MTPRVLFVGGEKGSWQVRGVQMANAMGARATQKPTDADWAWAQVVVLVKRAIHQWGETAQRFRIPIVWDVLDQWQQPEENGVPVAVHAAEVKRYAANYGVRTLIGATRAMADTVGGVYIPHHARPGLSPLPIREAVEIVAYEGNRKYLGAWLPVLERSCAARGWRFVVNPSSLAEADIVVALRDGVWDGPICREWKSGVKLVNAMAAGRPVITQDSAAQREIAAVGATLENPGFLDAALDYWTPVEHRQSAAEVSRDRALAYTRSSVANLYREHVLSLVRRAA